VARGDTSPGRQTAHRSACRLPNYGGYPKIASVISADLDKLGQAKPSDRVYFKLTTLEESINLMKQQENMIREIKSYCGAEEKNSLEYRIAGDRGILIYFGEEIDFEVFQRLLSFEENLLENPSRDSRDYKRILHIICHV